MELFIIIAEGDTFTPHSFCIFAHHRGHNFKLRLHVGNQLELGAAAFQFLLGVMVAEIVVTV